MNTDKETSQNVAGPSSMEIEALALKCGFNKSDEHWGVRYYTELGSNLFTFAYALLDLWGNPSRSHDLKSMQTDPTMTGEDAPCSSQIAHSSNEEILAKLKDPSAVHVNMLRGTIAPITFDQLAHVLGDESTNEWIANRLGAKDVPVLYTIESNGCLHSITHNTLDEARSFARNVNALQRMDRDPFVVVPLYRKAQPVTIPKGWALVPIEPTDEMLNSAQIENCDHTQCRNMWSEMVKNSPKPPTDYDAPVRVDKTAQVLTRFIAEKFSSGNAIPVERITITRSELEHLMSNEDIQAANT